MPVAARQPPPRSGHAVPSRGAVPRRDRRRHRADRLVTAQMPGRLHGDHTLRTDRVDVAGNHRSTENNTMTWAAMTAPMPRAGCFGDRNGRRERPDTFQSCTINNRLNYILLSLNWRPRSSTAASSTRVCRGRRATSTRRTVLDMPSAGLERRQVMAVSPAGRRRHRSAAGQLHLLESTDTAPARRVALADSTAAAGAARRRAVSLVDLRINKMRRSSTARGRPRSPSAPCRWTSRPDAAGDPAPMLAIVILATLLSTVISVATRRSPRRTRRRTGRAASAPRRSSWSPGRWPTWCWRSCSSESRDQRSHRGAGMGQHAMGMIGKIAPLLAQ